jgi:hypothetical protein
MLNGTSESFSSRRWAVTTISSSVAPGAALSCAIKLPAATVEPSAATVSCNPDFMEYRIADLPSCLF